MAKPAKDTTLHELFIDELRDVYHAERQLVKALPKLIKAATSTELRDALANHLGETQAQVTRLEQAFALLNEKSSPKPCKGIRGIIEEAAELLKSADKGAALDAGIIGGAQRAEHYEIAAYGTLLAWSNAMGHSAVSQLLAATLKEEKAADDTLSMIAERNINDSGADAKEVATSPPAEPAHIGRKRQARMTADTRREDTAGKRRVTTTRLFR